MQDSKLIPESGFSLIEILIALVLLSFIAISTIQITQEGLDTKESITQEDRYRLQLEKGLERMASDIAMLYNPFHFSPNLDIQKLLNKYPVKNTPTRQQPEVQEQTTPNNTVNNNTENSQTDDDKKNKQIRDRIRRAFEQIRNHYSSHENFIGPTNNLAPIPKFLNNETILFQFLTTGYRRKYQGEKKSDLSWIIYTLEDDQSKNDTNGNVNKSDADKVIKRYVFSNDPYSTIKFDIENLNGYEILENIKSAKMSFLKNGSFLEKAETSNAPIIAVKIFLEWENFSKQIEKIEKIFFTHSGRWSLSESQKNE